MRLLLVGRFCTISEEALEGFVAFVFKAGDDAASPKNYHPITLLNADYRLSAKVLNARLAPMLAIQDLGAGQSNQPAFSGALIGDNIAFLQLLPEVLHAIVGRGLPTSAVLAFLDFQKASDFAHSPCDKAALETVGAADGFLRWTSAPLSSIRAAAIVYGHMSVPSGPMGGWCAPGLAPIAVLLAAALQCLLKECPSVGAEVIPGHVVHASHQYADDTRPLHRGPWTPNHSSGTWTQTSSKSLS